MQIVNTMDQEFSPSTVMLVYGEGGVGKTTFATTAPKPIIADCEGGTKWLGLQGISADVAQITKWADMKEFLEVAKSGQYETIVIDPIGELMDKLKKAMVGMGDTKLVQKDGSPTQAGWGWVKKTMTNYLKSLRDTGFNVILIAHVEEVTDDQRLVKRPKIETKLHQDLVNFCEIVGYMVVTQEEGQTVRRILLDADSDRFVAKDRTGLLPLSAEPDFSKIASTTAEKVAEMRKEQEKKAKKTTQKSQKGGQSKNKGSNTTNASETEEEENTEELTNDDVQKAKEKLTKSKEA